MSGILVGVDGSGHSARALEWAAREAAVRSVPLQVLTVHQAVAGYSGMAVFYGGDEDATKRAQEAAQQLTDKVIGELDEASRPASVTVRAVHGFPSDELLSAAGDADLLVVGSRGAGGFRKLLLGSVGEQVAHHAHVPVVIIPAED